MSVSLPVSVGRIEAGDLVPSDAELGAFRLPMPLYRSAGMLPAYAMGIV